MYRTINLVKYSVIIIFAVLFLFQSRSLAVTNCDGIYSPKNPFPCTAPNGVQGNCTWWAWHWLRYGKGDRNVENSSSFRRDAKYWANDAVGLGYSVVTYPQIGAIAVNETYGGSGHVASVYQIDPNGVWVNEMNWSLTGFRQKFYANGFFTKFIVPFTQPKLNSFLPNPAYHANSDQTYWITGENLDRVVSVEITFPGGGKGILYGSGQIPGKSFSQLTIIATLGISGDYIFNVVTDQNIEAVPQMPVHIN